LNKVKKEEIGVNQAVDLNEIIVNAIQNVKGKNIVKLDMRNLDEAPTNYFIVCEGDSSTQISAIARSIHKDVKEHLGYNAEHKEGIVGSNWVLVDFFNTVIHIFHPDTRAFYSLEELWSDAELTEYKNL